MKKIVLIILIILNYSLISQIGNSQSIPGIYKNFTLLPNGWKLTPAGNKILIGEFPLNMIITKDEKFAITSNSGTSEHSLSLIDLKSKKEIQRIILNKTWRGLCFNNDETFLFASGGNNNLVYVLSFKNKKLELTDSIIIGQRFPKEKISISGLDFISKKNLLLAASKESRKLFVCDVKTKTVIKTIGFDSEIFEIKVNHQENFAYASLWGKSSIAEIDLEKLESTLEIKVGDHPCEILITKDDSRLFVTNANNNSTSVVDLISKKEIEQLNSAIGLNAPFGSTPNAVCFNRDESILFIANADNNYLSLFNIKKKAESKSLGFIPTGWYPTSVKFLKNSNQIAAVNSKGFGSSANPNGPNPLIKEHHHGQYIGSLFLGSISLIKNPSKKKLEQYTNQSYENTPYAGKKKNWFGIQKVIPENFSTKQSEKIKYVFYIIKENRTYDQVFGDLPQGNGDSSICIFPKLITPNQHKLAETWTLFDNFYVDAEVSADGHNWSTAAYATDYVEKTWPTYYGGRGGNYDFEGGVPIAAPSSGYIWDNLINNGKNLSLRNYGEFTKKVKDAKVYYRSDEKNLKDWTCANYPGYDLNISDIYRFEKWKEEFEQFEKDGSLPNLNIIRLPNDHTWGTAKDRLTPKAYVAQNDFAVGLMIEKITKSKFWNQSIIFVLEDDAQNGSDHIDAHRSTLLVISPFIKRNFVDHNMYSTSSVLKTIELIFGLPPMTQYDFSATPILFPITDKPDYSSYKHIPPFIDIEEKNTADAYGSKRIDEMNLTKEDAIPDIEFNEIIWKSIKGKDSMMPSPVRSAFVNYKTK